MSELSDAQCDRIIAAIEEERARSNGTFRYGDTRDIVNMGSISEVWADEGLQAALRASYAPPQSSESDETGGNATQPPNSETNPPTAIVNQTGWKGLPVELCAHNRTNDAGPWGRRCIDCGSTLIGPNPLHGFTLPRWWWSDAEGMNVYAVRADWPPPARGTHSSDIRWNEDGGCPCQHTSFNIPGQTYNQHLDEYEIAVRWTREGL